MNTVEIENRFIDLEIILAQYEHTIQSLNQTVTEQALRLDKLERTLTYLIQNLDTSGQVRPLSEETPPPHY